LRAAVWLQRFDAATTGERADRTLGPPVSLGYGKAGDLEHKAVALALSSSFP